MGSEGFESYREHPDAQTAFCMYSTHEDDHLSEKYGFTIITRTPLTYTAATDLAGQLFEKDDARICDKWGPAGAIPVCEDGNTRTVKVTVDATDDPNGYAYQIVKAAAMAKAKPGESIMETNIVSDTAKHKTVAVRTEGKTTTRYFIKKHGTYQKNLLVGDQNGYDTVAAARAVAIELADKHADVNEVEFTIEGRVTRPEGEPLVVVKRETKKRTIVADVTFVAPKNSNVIGWYFFGYYNY